MAASEQRLVDDEHPYVLEDADHAGGANDDGGEDGEDGEDIIPWAQPVAGRGPADGGVDVPGAGMSCPNLMAETSSPDLMPDDPSTRAAMSAEQ